MENVIIIMAGGLGKRMNSDLPKVLHKINNKPMLVHVIEQAIDLNPCKILIVVGKYKTIIEETISQYINSFELRSTEFSRSSTASHPEIFANITNIQFILQPEPLGTGHAIQCCREELLKMPGKNVLILSGDVPLFKSSTMRDMLYRFNHANSFELQSPTASRPDIFATVATTIMQNPYGYGRIIQNSYGFEKIVEEKDASMEEKCVKKVNCGIYIMTSNLLCKYLPLLKNDNNQKEYYLTDIIELIKCGENVSIDLYDIPQERQYEIIGVNTIEQLRDLEELLRCPDANR